MKRIACLLFSSFLMCHAQDSVVKAYKIVPGKVAYSIQIEGKELSFALPESGYKDYWGVSISRLPGSKTVFSIGLWSALKYADMKDEAGDFVSMRLWSSEIDSTTDKRLEWKEVGGVAGWGFVKADEKTLSINLSHLRYADEHSTFALRLHRVAVK